MLRSLRVWLPALGVCAASLCLGGIIRFASGQTGQPAPVDPARWVPADVLAYVGIADVGRLGDEFRRTAFYKLTQELGAQELPRYMSRPVKIYEGLKAYLARALDTEPDQLRNPFAGPLALYLPLPVGAAADDVKVVLVAGVGDAELMKSYYERAARKLREMADHHEQIAFGAYTIDRFTSDAPAANAEGPQDEVDFEELDFGTLSAEAGGFAAALDEAFGKLFSADALPSELVLCLTEDRLIVAPTAEHVTGILRRERLGDSLVDTKAYQTLLREFKPLGSVRWLVNLPALFEMMEAVEGQEATAALAMLGAKSMRSAVGHVLLANKELESKLEALLLLEGERTGLAKILSMKNRTLTPPPSVSADSLICASVNADVCEVLDELERMIRQEDPAAADQMRASMESLAMPDGQALHLRTELLEKLRAPLTFALSIRRPYGPRSTRILLTLGHRDKEALADFFKKLSSVAAGVIIEREAGGTVAYDVSFGGFSFASTDNAIIAGTTNAVDAALNAPPASRSLASDPAFQRAAALAPREAWGMAYVDSRRMFEAALEMAKRGGAQETVQVANPANLALGIVGAFTKGIDPGRTDVARRLSRHLAPRIITVATTPDGIRVTQIQLAPENGG